MIGQAVAHRLKQLPFLRRPRRGPLAFLALLGPGLIAANAGNDAGGIATYASVGAQFGYRLLWVMVLITISLSVVQEMAARMGAVTGKGFADLVREQLGVRITAFLMAVLVIANGGLVVSEFVGIAAAAGLFGISRYIAVPVMAILLWWLILRGSYGRVERIFLAMTLLFFAYPIAAFLVKPHWGEVGHHLVVPSVTISADYLTLLIALVGTTVTPYMQLYLQSAVAEKGGGVTPEEARIDAYSGSIFGNLISIFIIIATGATLFVSKTPVNTAADAARALRPLAGDYAKIIFGVGLLGASVLAAAVLPLATAYTVTEAFGFEKGVSRTFREAPVFLGLFTALIVIGAAGALWPGLNVIQLLVYTQVLNGIVLPIVLISILRLVNDPDVMGKHVNGLGYNILASATVVIVAGLSTVYLAITIAGMV